MNPVEPTQPVPVAIIGMGCMFPRAEDLAGYWANIRQRRDAITEVPATHWRPEDYFDADPKAPDHTYARRGGFLTPVDFPPLEFGIAPNNLDATDTTQLLGLMVARQALEDAGYGEGSKKALDRDRVSVILGVTGTLELVIPLGARLGHPIWRRALKASGVPEDQAEEVVKRISDSYVGWQENSFPGLLGNVAAGRIANRLDLGGTNCVIDAACASSVGALSLAMLELATGRCDMALTGGLDTFNDIFMYMCFSKTPALSPRGDARPFDAGCDGTILGEGLGVLALKRLDDAKRDGDMVYAVIRSVGSSSDGKGGAVYAPKAEGQAKALRQAYRQAGITPDTVELVEAHGTGTKVGDATELAALNEVYGEAKAGSTWCALGSVKSQIGHTKAAAGAAGIIKAALALHHKVLPPTIKVTAPVEGVGPGRSPFYLNTEPRPWLPRAGHPRRAAVSAFGFGGSNFHCVLEEAEPVKPAIDWDGETQILAFSGATPADLLKKLDAWPVGLDWRGVRTEAARSRAAFQSVDPYRLVLVADAESDLPALLAKGRAALDSEAARGPRGRAREGVFVGSGAIPGKLGLLFPGQGSQYVGMLRDLSCVFPQMQDALAQAVALDGDAALRLSDQIYPFSAFHDAERQAHERALRSTEIAQPAIGAISLGLLRVLEHFGVKADAVAGHSFGELTALCAAGWIDAASFARLARERGRLMAEQGRDGGGAMLAVLAARDVVDEVLKAEGLGTSVVVANKNAPKQIVLSGPAEAIEVVAKALQRRKITTRTLAVSAAFHSPAVAAASEPFLKAVQAERLTPTATPVYANATAAAYPAEAEAARELLAGQIARPVEFVAEIEAMARAGVGVFLEVGPDAKLTGLVRAILEGTGTKTPARAIALDASRGERGNLADLASALAELAAFGYPVSLDRWDDGADRLALPVRKPGLTVKLSGANIAPKPHAEPDPTTPTKTKTKTTTDAPRPGATNPVSAPAVTSTRFPQASAPMTPTPPTRPRPPAPNPIDQSNGSGRNGHHAGELELVLQRPRPSCPGERNAAARPDRFERPRPDRAGAAHGPGKPRRAPEAERADRRAAPAVPRRPGQDPAHLSESSRPAAASDPRLPRHDPGGGVPCSCSEYSRPASDPQPDPEPPAPRFVAPQPQVQAQPPAPPSPQAPPAVAPGLDVQAILLEVVSEKTGYPAEMLEPDMQLDADLGIDSIKRVEILSALQERLPDAPIIQPEHLATLRTLRDIAGFLGSAGGKSPSSDPGPQATAPAADVQAILLEVVAEKTGYPAEMLEPDMQLDADLGIDSIKRVEILSALQERLPDAPIIKPEHLATLRTLRDIAGFLGSTGGRGPSSDPGPQTLAPAADVQAILLEVVAEKTGYPAEMLEPDMQLDADLGIDSIKRVEILSALQERLPDAPIIKPEHLATLRTLRDIAGFLGASPISAVPPLGRGIEGGSDSNSNPRGTSETTVQRWVVRTSPLPLVAEAPLRQGAEVWVTDSGDDLSATVVERLGARGYQARLVGWDEAESESVVGAPVDALVLIAPMTPDDADELVARAFRWLRGAGPNLTSGALAVTVTRLDGGFGLRALGDDSDPTLGGLAGLIKTAGHEWPEVRCKAIDLDPALEVEGAAESLVAELFRPGPAEVGLSASGRLTLSLSAEVVGPQGIAGPNPIEAGDLVIVTGGARGVTAEVAVALAEAFRPTLVLLGRSDRPELEPDWLAPLAGESEIKRALASRANGRATPQLIGEQFRKVAANREILQTLARIEATGSRAVYRRVDVRDPEAVALAVAAARAEFGPVRGLVHGAGVLADRKIADQTDAQFAEVYRTKVAGLRGLLQAVAADELKLLVLFSSSTARFGRLGQVAYAAANEVLNKQGQAEAIRRPGCRVLAVNWGPWDGGMVTPSLASVFASEGVALIPLRAGARFLVDEIRSSAASASVEVVVLGAGSVDPSPLPPPPPEPESKPVAKAVSLTTVFERPLDPGALPILRSHVIDGRAVLPMALTLEWLAQGALQRNPGLVFCGLDDLRLFKGVVASDDEPETIAVLVGKAAKQPSGLYRSLVELRGIFPGGRTLTHARAEVLLGDRLPSPAPGLRTLDPAGLPAFGKTPRTVYHDLLFHGADLHGLERIDICTVEMVSGWAKTAPSPSAWIDRPLRQTWLSDPLVLDCAFQLMVLWSAEHAGAPSLPTAIGHYRQFCRTFPTPRVQIVARVERPSALHAVAAIEFLDPSGTLLARIDGYECVANPSLLAAFRRNRLPKVVRSPG